MIANCRLHGITFGNAFLALAQVAMTRVLYRRYLRGEISEEEWAYRKRQPCISGGPLSLRPYLDKAWFQNGGEGEQMMSIALFHFQLPLMTLGDTTEHQRVLSNGAPPLPNLLTFDRFLHRTGLIERQLATFFSHPLFLDILRATCQADIEHTRLDTLKWMKHVGTPNSDDAGGSLDHEVLAVTDIPTVWASVGSSAGNVRHVPLFDHPFSPLACH